MARSTNGPGNGFSFAGFMGWWLSGLSCCLPRFLRSGNGASKRRLLEISADHATAFIDDREKRQELGSSVLAEANRVVSLLNASNARTSPMVVWVAEPLVRRLSLPLEVEGSLRQVLGYEMDRYTPFNIDQVYFDCRVVGRNQELGRLEVDLVLVQKQQIQPWLDALKRMGIRASEISWQAGWPGANLLPSELRPRKSRLALLTNLALLSTALALAAALLLVPLLQKREAVLVLGEHLMQARAAANEIVDLRNRLEERGKSARFVLEQRHATIPIVDVLAELTELIPDDTWIQQFKINKGTIDLQGESALASTLIAVLEGSELFSSVSFSSPVTQLQGTGRERFHIRLSMAERESP